MLKYIYKCICLKDGDLNDSGTAGMSDNKRALHNAMERKRRDSIKVQRQLKVGRRSFLKLFLPPYFLCFGPF